MKFSQVLEYKTQTQISHHQIQAQTTNPSINPTKSTPNNHLKSRLKKIKTPKPTRSSIWTMDPSRRGRRLSIHDRTSVASMSFMSAHARSRKLPYCLRLASMRLVMARLSKLHSLFLLLPLLFSLVSQLAFGRYSGESMWPAFLGLGLWVWYYQGGGGGGNGIVFIHGGVGWGEWFVHERAKQRLKMQA